VIIEWLERVTHRKFTNRFTNREFNTSKGLDTPKIHQSHILDLKIRVYSSNQRHPCAFHMVVNKEIYNTSFIDKNPTVY
jgi:hypothetical protein